MSTARANTFANLAGTGSPDIVGGELSRARFNLNGTGTIAARDSYNCSSFVDGGVGDYTVNFAVAFPAADYAMGQSIRFNGSVDPTSNPAAALPRTVLVGSTRLACVHGTVTALDYDLVSAAFFGDKP